MRAILIVLVLCFANNVLAQRPVVTFVAGDYLRVNEFIPIEVTTRVGQAFTIETEDGVQIEPLQEQNSWRGLIFAKAGTQGFTILSEGESYPVDWPKQVVPRSNEDFLVLVADGLPLPSPEETPKGVRFLDAADIRISSSNLLLPFDAVVSKRQFSPSTPFGCFALCWEGSGGNNVTWKSDTEPDAKISAWSELLPALRALKRVDAGGIRPMPVLAPIPLSIPSYEQRLHWDDSQLRRISPHFGYAAFVVLASLVVLAGLGVRKRGRGTRTIVLACVCAVVCTGVVFAAITSWHSNKKKFHAQQDQYSNSSPMYAVSLNMENALHYVEAHPDAHQRASRTFHGDTVAIATISEIGNVKALVYGEDEIRTPPGALLAVFANNNGLYSLESGSAKVLLKARTLVQEGAPYVRAGAESIPLNDFSTTLLDDDPMGRALLDAWLKHLFVAGRDWEITIWRDSKKSVYIDFSLLPANPIDNPPSSR